MLRSLRFPGAVVVAQGARFVCFYNGGGQEVNNKLVTPMLTTEIDCPQVAADDKYRVSFLCCLVHFAGACAGVFGLVSLFCVGVFGGVFEFAGAFEWFWVGF